MTSEPTPSAGALVQINDVTKRYDGSGHPPWTGSRSRSRRVRRWP